LQSDYSYERKEYDWKRKALADIRAEIIKSIKRDFISYTYNTETVYNLLVKLKERIAPIDKIRKRELITVYKVACKPPKA
jgi:tRNA A37 threonylcarbamoyladenosine synthetase subunit TsaC/SUA5/YrdC